MREIKLNESKKIILDILIYFDLFCKKNNLHYCLFYGTLLGAIRHKGFIPWDDDIAMPIEDFEKLKEMKFNNQYKFNYFNKNSNYGYYFGKITDNRTIIKNEYIKEIDNGLFIDIFPVVKVKTSNIKMKFYQLKMKILTKLSIYANLKKYWGSNNFFKNSIKYVLFLYANLFEKNHWNKKIYKLLKKMNSLSGKNRGSYNLIDINIIPQIDFDNLITCKFENIDFMIPQNYHDILISLYGDYMQLPKEEERISTHDFIGYWK